MRIAVLGAGAMGSWFGGQLARHGSDVQLLTTNQSHIDAITGHGLILQGPETEHTLTIAAHHPRDIQMPVDLVLLFTKSFQSDAAMNSIAHAIDDNTHVLSLQNGLGNAEVIARHIAAPRIWVGVTMMPVDVVKPGIVACKGDGPGFFGPGVAEAHSVESSMPARLLEAFSAAGIPLEYDPDIHKRIWEKVAFNAGMNALAALSHGTPGTIGRSPGAKQLARDVAAEVAAVARANQIKLDIDSVFGTIDFACDKHQDHKPSMLQDLEAGNTTEIDSLCGAVAGLSEQAGVAAPLNKTLTTLVKLAELSQKN